MPDNLGLGLPVAIPRSSPVSTHSNFDEDSDNIDDPQPMDNDSPNVQLEDRGRPTPNDNAIPVLIPNDNAIPVLIPNGNAIPVPNVGRPNALLSGDS